MFSTIVQQAHDGIVLIDTDTLRFVEFNEAAHHGLGYNRNEFAGLTLNDIQAENTPAQIRARIQELIVSGGGEYELTHRRKNGSQRITRVSNRIVNLHGRRFLSGIWVDMTERRSFEAHLRKLELAVEQSPHSIVITDRDARIEYVNAAFTQVTGYSREEACTSTPELLHSGQTPPQTYAALWAALSKGESWKGQFINRRKNGEIYYEFALVSPIRQADGEITHYLAIKEDITEKKRIGLELDRHRNRLEHLVAERTSELEEARQVAEAASYAKSAFLANMSHEIRTPMNAIIGLTHLAQRDASNPSMLERLGKVSDAAHHLLAIINQILDISKIEAGRLTLDKIDFELAHMVNNAVTLVIDKIQSRGLQLTLNIDPALPVMVLGDPLRIGQILLNFLSNAVKFTERGSIAIDLDLLEETPSELKLRLAVSDTGTGIAEQAMPRLFKAFEQADSSITRKYGGTGLGLAICKRLAELMGGEIGVDSTAGEGSRFWVTLTLQHSALQTPALSAPGASAGEFVFGQPPPAILLVEDNEINQEVALDLLRGAGLRVDLAENGLQAVEKVAQNAYDLILMDMQMPVMDGLSATRAIRAAETAHRTPILAMTANAFSEDRQQCLAAGMDDHIAKPVNPDSLFAALIKWLPTHQAVPTAAPASTQPLTGDLRQQLAGIPGLDIEAGLQAVRGREASYLRLLGKFAETHAEDAHQIRKHLANSETETARRIAHSLKGAAGTLGMNSLQAAAAALELSLKENAPRSERDLLADQLAGTIDRTVGPLLDALPAPKTE